jgi:hypothetical protein
LAIEGVYGALRFFIAIDFDESKTARLPSKTIANQIDG